MTAQAWWMGWMHRIRWSALPSMSYPKQIVRAVGTYVGVQIAPTCRCGALMRVRAGYLMGGTGSWVAYECPKDRPWCYWMHSPWTTLIYTTPKEAA